VPSAGSGAAKDEADFFAGAVWPRRAGVWQSVITDELHRQPCSALGRGARRGQRSGKPRQPRQPGSQRLTSTRSTTQMRHFRSPARCWVGLSEAGSIKRRSRRGYATRFGKKPSSFNRLGGVADCDPGINGPGRCPNTTSQSAVIATCASERSGCSPQSTIVGACASEPFGASPQSAVMAARTSEPRGTSAGTFCSSEWRRVSPRICPALGTAAWFTCCTVVLRAGVSGRIHVHGRNVHLRL
jgi:hypothetical protein